MNNTLRAGLVVLAVMSVNLALAANPPAPAAPSAPPAPPPAPTSTTTTMVYCFSAGKALASCAASWEEMVAADNKVSNAKMAWEASGFMNYVGATAFITQDSSWCDATGHTDEQTMFTAVAKFIRENPDKAAGNSAAALTNLALKSSFPCVKKSAH